MDLSLFSRTKGKSQGVGVNARKTGAAVTETDGVLGLAGPSVQFDQ